MHLALIGLLGVLLAGRPVAANETVVLDVPLESFAGEDVTVVARGLVGDGDLLITTGYGVFRERLTGNVPHVVSGLHLRGSGDVRWDLLPSGKSRAGDRARARQGTSSLLAPSVHSWIHPGHIAEPLVATVGPRAIGADGNSWALVVVNPRDRFGNPPDDADRASNSSTVHVHLQRVDGKRQELVAPVIHGLSWSRVTSGTVAGTTRVAVDVDITTGEKIRGPAQTLLEMPGAPEPFSLSADRTEWPANGNALVLVRTSLLRDRFGNAVVDGTRVTFRADGEGGTDVLPAVAVRGIAEVPVRAPLHGALRVTAEAAGGSSAPLDLRFGLGPAVGVAPMQLAFGPRQVAGKHPDYASQVQGAVPGDVLVVRVGPLLGTLGETVPDATPVRLRVRNRSHDEVVLERPALNGRVIFEIDRKIARTSADHREVTLLVDCGDAHAELQGEVP